MSVLKIIPPTEKVVVSKEVSDLTEGDFNVTSEPGSLKVVEKEEEDIFEIEEIDGLVVPDGIVAQAAMIDKKMILLYGKTQPYSIVETEAQINVTIDETLESFYIKK